MSDGILPKRGCSRRDVIRSLAGGALALTVLPRCGAPAPATSADAGVSLSCDGSHGTEADGWVSVPLADYPALATVGGSVVIQDRTSLLDVIVVQTAPDCFAAVWRVCTHGACEVDYQSQESLVECPCHGSRFGLDGAVLRGPATRPLSAFHTVKDGETLWIHRWE